MSDTGRLALRARDGSIRAWALVDAADYPQLSRWRWSVHGAGYAHAYIDGDWFLLHRWLMGLSKGDGLEVDHINRDRLDCRRANLRVVTHAQNAQNFPSHAGASSDYRGVSWNKNAHSWEAYVMLAGRRYYLGLHLSERLAARAVAAFRRAHMPFSSADVA